MTHESIFNNRNDRLAGAAAFMFLLERIKNSRKETFTKTELIVAIDGTGRMNCGEALWEMFKAELAEEDASK